MFMDAGPRPVGTGFHGFGDSTESVQALAEQTVTRLTAIHHRHARDTTIPVAVRSKGAKLIRDLCEVMYRMRYAEKVPSEEMLAIHRATAVIRDYRPMIEAVEKLLRSFRSIH